MQKVLETANIKLGDVATDVLGASGRAMLKALIAGERDAHKLAALARGLLRKKEVQLREALVGRVTDHHAFMLQGLLSHIEFLDQQIALFDGRIEVQTRPFMTVLERLDTITGVARRSAEQILAELGDDMSRFPTSDHLTAWAGLAPGNNESAGKRKGGKTRKGSRWLRAALINAAHGAARKKGSALAAQYKRIAARRGAKRAAVAVARSILVIIYHLLRDKGTYHEPDLAYRDERRRHGALTGKQRPHRGRRHVRPRPGVPRRVVVFLLPKKVGCRGHLGAQPARLRAERLHHRGLPGLPTRVDHVIGPAWSRSRCAAQLTAPRPGQAGAERTQIGVDQQRAVHQHSPAAAVRRDAGHLAPAHAHRALIALRVRPSQPAGSEDAVQQRCIHLRNTEL